MKYHDVFFREETVDGNSKSMVSSLLNEFAEPATWDEYGYEDKKYLIEFAKEYMCEVLNGNGLITFEKDEALYVWDGYEVINIFYGFTPVWEDYEDVNIPERSFDNLKFLDYGKTNSKEISVMIPKVVEELSCDEQMYRCESLRFFLYDIQFSVEWDENGSIDMEIEIGEEDTIDDVRDAVINEVRTLLAWAEMPFSVLR